MVTGIPPKTHRRVLRKKCGKYGPVEELSYPVATDISTETDVAVATDIAIATKGGGVCEGLVAHVTYKDCQDARKAARVLEGLKLPGAVNPLRAVLMSREGKSASKKTLKKSRLIVRNLSFQCHAEELRRVFSKYGEVAEVHIPRKPNGHMLGYGFVQFMSYFDAARALKGE